MARKRKPPEFYLFEARSRLAQDKNGGWKHKYMDNGSWKTDTTVNIAMSMLTSPAFCDLTPRQRQLYLIAKAQFFGAVSRPGTDFPDIQQYQQYDRKMYFYLNNALAVDVYRLYSKSDRRGFYNDVAALEAHGFIERVTNTDRQQITHTNKQRTIFRYSEGWKAWTGKEDAEDGKDRKQGA